MEKPFSAYRGDHPYVFVCYAHEDSEAVFREIACLHHQGVNIWYDEGIRPGLEWTDALANAIQGCRKVLFFVTPRSVASEHCRRELNFALEESREVLAVHLQPTEVPPGLRLSLNNRQAILKHELPEDHYRQELVLATDTEVGFSTTSAQPTTGSGNHRRQLLVLAAAATVAIAGFWWSKGTFERFSPSVDATIAKQSGETDVLRNSIAVLPFENLSLDPEDAYFAAGIHEEVLNQLTKIQDLSVIARTTMLRYADTDKSVPEIGAELNVRTVMEGNVRYAGERVRITAKLINAASGAHLWSEAYDGDLHDIFGIQLAIATKIAGTLEAEFSSGEQTRIATRSTDDPVAYAHYLRAISSWGNYAPIGPMHEAIDAAIARDPDFAGALTFKAFLHAIETLAGSAFVGPNFGADDQRHSASLAQEYAMQALEIDGNQARAYWVLGWVHVLKREWETSYRHFDRALELNPNDYIVLNGAAWTSLIRGDVEEGVQLMERSVALNPGDIANQGNFMGFLFWCQRWEDVKRQANLITAVFPDAAGPYITLASVASYLDDPEGVRVNATLAEDRSSPPNLELAIAYSRIGDDANARRIVTAAESGSPSSFSSTWMHAEVKTFWMHVVIKEYDVALDYLEHALDEGFPWAAARDVHFLSHHPAFDPVRDHPKFQELVRKTGLPRNRG